jgi:hypothetical protein
MAAATPPNQPQQCILIDYFNNYNFSKAQIIHSLMMVIEPKHVGAVLVWILIFFWNSSIVHRLAGERP